MPVPALGGLLVPAVTPFHADTGEIAKASFVRNLEAHLAAGLDGVLIAGSSGEASLLGDAERRSLAEWAREVVPAHQMVMVGTGSESTRGTISRCHDAKAAGADAVLVIAPHYFLKRMSEAALLAHFHAVADASPLPVLLYNMPAYAHLVLSADLVHTMAQHENVVGMKDSAGNLDMLTRYLEAQGERFTVLTGNGGNADAAIVLGAKGAILAIALYAGVATRAMVQAALSGDAEGAAQQQAVLLPLARDIAAAFGPAGLKAAMDLVGLDGGAPRLPLLPASQAEQAAVREVLVQAGVLGG